MRTLAIGAALVVMFESPLRAADTPVQAEEDRSKVLVVVDGDDKVVIEERKEWLESIWVPKCFASCWLPIGSTVRIAGPGVVPSDPIIVRGMFGSTTTLDVKSASSTAAGWGVALLTGGLLVDTGAAIAGLFGGISQEFCGFTSCDHAWVAPVAGVAIAGGIAAVAGIVLMALNSTTHVHLR